MFVCSLLCINRYKEGGPAAVANFEAGAEGFTTRAFRGCGVVTSEPFEVSDDMEAVQMLQRFTQVGEFYVMSTPDGIGTAKDKVGFMDVLVYDEESDRHVKISYRSALESTGLFNVGDYPATTVALTNGIENKPLSYKDAKGGDMTLEQYAEAATILLAANEKPEVTITAAGEKGAPIALARPFIEHAMLSAVLTVSGGDTGATIFGPSDMQISANTSVKTIEGYALLLRTHSHTHFLSISIPWHGVPAAHTLCECNGGRDTMDLQEQRWVQIGVLARHSSKEVAVQDYVLSTARSGTCLC